MAEHRDRTRLLIRTQHTLTEPPFSPTLEDFDFVKPGKMPSDRVRKWPRT